MRVRHMVFPVKEHIGPVTRAELPQPRQAVVDRRVHLGEIDRKQLMDKLYRKGMYLCHPCGVAGRGIGGQDGQSPRLHRDAYFGDRAMLCHHGSVYHIAG